MQIHLDTAQWLLLWGTLATLLYTIVICVYASGHYTRIPGGPWTIWEKTVAPKASRVRSSEERAA